VEDKVKRSIGTSLWAVAFSSVPALVKDVLTAKEALTTKNFLIGTMFKLYFHTV